MTILYYFLGDYMKFERLYELREENNIKQISLADELNIKQGTYSDYENGVINVPVEAFIKLAKYYNTSADYLLGLTDQKEPYPRKK